MNGTPDIIQDSARDRRASLLDEERFDLIEVSFRQSG